MLLNINSLNDGHISRDNRLKLDGRLSGSILHAAFVMERIAATGVGAGGAAGGVAGISAGGVAGGGLPYNFTSGTYDKGNYYQFNRASQYSGWGTGKFFPSSASSSSFSSGSGLGSGLGSGVGSGVGAGGVSSGVGSGISGGVGSGYGSRL